MLQVRAAILGDFQPKLVNSIPMKLEEGYFDLVSSSAYLHHALVFSPAISFLIFLRFVLVLLGGDRRPFLEAPSEGGRHRARDKACFCREAQDRARCGEEEREEEEPRAVGARGVSSQGEA